MNIERLNKILLEIQKDYKKIKLVEKLQLVRDNLQNQVSNPSHAPYQETLVTSIKELYVALEKSEINNFGPNWLQTLEEIGGDEIFGIKLKNRIENIFSTNQITPAFALQNINELLDYVVNFAEAMESTLTGFDSFDIGKDELEPGECELAYMIPRLFVKNKLSSLNKEISELNYILNIISETVTGEKEEFEVKTISSSEFLLYVLVSLSVGKVIGEVVERIINNYKTILEIKKLRNELKSQGVPDKDTKGIEQHANSLMESEIKKIVDYIFKTYGQNTDATRTNELKNGFTIALNKIANRIDYGFNIDVRVKELSASTEENKAEIEMINSIKEKSKTLEFINIGGQPILQLRETEEIKKSK